MKEKIKEIIEALEKVSPHLDTVPPNDTSLRLLHSQLVSLIAFPYISIELSDDVRADIVALRKYLVDYTDPFAEKFDAALEPIRTVKLPGEDKTIETITQDTINSVLKLARHIAETYR